MEPHIIILGAGPAGLGAARLLALRTPFQVTVLEQNAWVGGNAGSFELAGVHVDYGSHRLHPSCDPEILKDIRQMLGSDLLDRPRHGRIRLRGRWIHFPLKPMDLFLRLPPKFAVGVLSDMVGKTINMNGVQKKQDTFASAMVKGLGRTICQDFYFPYARKIWGIEPEEISITQAQRRVSNSSLSKMIRKVVLAIPGLKPEGSGRFFYPRNGYGQISEAYRKSAEEAGAKIILNANVKSVELNSTSDRKKPSIVQYEEKGLLHTLKADFIWSTIPITILGSMLKPAPPAEILDATKAIDYRAMILVYLVLETNRFTEYDAHYFPGEEIAITRLSEPKNYSNRQDPEGKTVLCAELPCSLESDVWRMDDESLGRLVCKSLQQAGIPVNVPIQQVSVRRLRYAYPIYRIGYEQFFKPLDDWIGQFDSLLSFGRQGLFAHDNTHHTLFMAYSAVACLDETGKLNKECWGEYRKIFNTHVVED
jgi:protoporphyrinogen oxidase